MKRFYKQVDVAADGGGNFVIELDGKAVKTQNAGKTLSCSSETLAAAIAKEWRDQEDVIDPQNMPLTQVMSTIIDTNEVQRKDITKAVLGYINTDLLCYRAEKPDELRKRQEAAWNPPLDWFLDIYGYQFETTFGLAALTQVDAIHKVFENEVAVMDMKDFTVFQITTSITGSVILALGFVKEAVDINSIFAAVFVDELYRAEIYDEKKYGVDPMQEKQRESLLRDLNAMHLILHSYKN